MVAKVMKGGIADSNVGYLLDTSKGKEDQTFRGKKKAKKGQEKRLSKQHGKDKERYAALHPNTPLSGRRQHYELIPHTTTVPRTNDEEAQWVETTNARLLGAPKILDEEKVHVLGSIYDTSAVPDPYLTSAENRGDRRTKVTEPSSLENELMKVRADNCGRAIKRACRVNCNPIIGTQKKCSECVDDPTIEEKCKGNPKYFRNDYPDNLMERLDNATPERADNVALRSEKEGRKQIEETINKAPEDRNVVNWASRSLSRRKAKKERERIKREEREGRGKHGISDEILEELRRKDAEQRREAAQAAKPQPLTELGEDALSATTSSSAASRRSSIASDGSSGFFTAEEEEARPEPAPVSGAAFRPKTSFYPKAGDLEPKPEPEPEPPSKTELQQPEPEPEPQSLTPTIDRNSGPISELFSGPSRGGARRRRRTKRRKPKKSEKSKKSRKSKRTRRR